MTRKIVSVMVFPILEGIRVEITRQNGMFDTSTGRLTRWYWAPKENKSEIDRMLRHATALNGLIYKRIGESYD